MDPIIIAFGLVPLHRPSLRPAQDLSRNSRISPSGDESVIQTSTQHTEFFGIFSLSHPQTSEFLQFGHSLCSNIIWVYCILAYTTLLGSNLAVLPRFSLPAHQHISISLPPHQTISFSLPAHQFTRVSASATLRLRVPRVLDTRI